MKHIKLTEREKYLAITYKTRDCHLQNVQCLPLRFESKIQLEQIQQKAAGQFWFVGYWAEMYVAFSPQGKRKYFEYFMFDSQTKEQSIKWKKIAKQAAKLWAEGKAYEANKKYREIGKDYGKYL